MNNKLVILAFCFSGLGFAACSMPPVAAETKAFPATEKTVNADLSSEISDGLAPGAAPAVDDRKDTSNEMIFIVTKSGEKYRFSVEIADDLESQRRGLMFRRELAASSGMLFDFGKSRQVHMWMKNTYIPLDILFVSAGGRIVNIEANTVPHSLKRLSSDGAVKAALEINAGLTWRFGIRPGDKIIHPIFE